MALPSLKLDGITLALLLFSALPWLAPLIRSVELPGGLKIELQEVKAATDKVVETPEVVESSLFAAGDLSLGELDLDGGAERRQAIERLSAVAASDPNLALIGVGIEVEKRLRDLAEKAGIGPTTRSPSYLVAELQTANVLPLSVASGLRDLIALRNRAAHGTTVDEGAARWALDELPTLLSVLDHLDRVSKRQRK